MRHARAQIVATIGPVSKSKDVLEQLFVSGVDIIRLNFSWGTYDEHSSYIKETRELANKLQKKVSIIQDLSGPRIQTGASHGFNSIEDAILTDKDLRDLEFGIKEGVEYIAQSFVGTADDVLLLRGHIANLHGTQKIIAKIERKIAVENIASIIEVVDGIMIARGDLGNEVPLEDIPLIERDIIALCKAHGKPVIVATQMFFSMIHNPIPTRAEMTDVEYAILNGADAVMLSDETAMGHYPVETVSFMEKGILAAEQRLDDDKIAIPLNLF